MKNYIYLIVFSLLCNSTSKAETTKEGVDPQIENHQKISRFIEISWTEDDGQKFHAFLKKDEIRSIVIKVGIAEDEGFFTVVISGETKSDPINKTLIFYNWEKALDFSRKLASEMQN